MVGVTIPVVLELPDVAVIGVEPCSDGTYRIAVQSTAEAPCCDRCGRRCSPHGHDEEIQLRHLAIMGKPCILELRPRRFICLNCAGTPTSTERLIWHQLRSPHTRAYDEYLGLPHNFARRHGAGASGSVGGRRVRCRGRAGRGMTTTRCSNKSPGFRPKKRSAAVVPSGRTMT